MIVHLHVARLPVGQVSYRLILKMGLNVPKPVTCNLQPVTIYYTCLVPAH